MKISLGPLLDNVFFQFITTYLGTNLTAFRVAWKHLVNENDTLPYLDNQLPVTSGAATVVHFVKPCMRKLDFGAKSMFFLDENRDCG